MFINMNSAVFAILIATVASAPLPTKDVEIVESTIREVRAIAPDDLLLAATNYGHDYGVHDDDAVGYLKKTEDGGSDGYKHFDSYHKKDGDKYGYEKHTAFGNKDHSNYDDAGAEAGADDGGDEKQSYKVAEEVNEDDGEVENFEPLEKYTNEENSENQHYTEGAEGAENAEEADGDNEHYTDGEGFYGFEDGESEKYTDGETEAEESDEY